MAAINKGKPIIDISAQLLVLLNPLSTSETIAAILGSFNSEDWQNFRQYLVSHSLANLLYARFQQMGLQVLVPPDAVGFLRENYLANAARNLLLLTHAAEVLAALQAEGIPVIGLKGLYLLENVYKDIGVRAMNDLDILVRHEDIPHTIETLQRLSYMPSTFFDGSAPNQDVKHVPPMSLADGTTIEAHWSLLEEDEPFAIDPRGLWQRARPARLAETDACALSVEDLILHLCIHAVYQHYLKIGLRGMLDIALVLKNGAEHVNWSKLNEIAREWGAEKTLALSFGLLQDMGWARLPEVFLSDLLPEPLDTAILTKAKSLLLQENLAPDVITPDVAALTSTKNLVQKARVVLNRIFIPRPALARLYKLNPNSPGILLGYFRRTFDLFRQYGRTVRKISAKDEAIQQDLEHEKDRFLIHDWQKPN